MNFKREAEHEEAREGRGSHSDKTGDHSCSLRCLATIRLNLEPTGLSGTSSKSSKDKCVLGAAKML